MRALLLYVFCSIALQRQNHDTHCLLSLFVTTALSNTHSGMPHISLLRLQYDVNEWRHRHVCRPCNNYLYARTFLCLYVCVFA